VLWLAVLALQIVAAVLTQSRGPLIGLAVALFVLLLLLGAQARARGLVLAAFGIMLAGALALALINFVPALAQSVNGTPLQRFVFTGADLTTDSRVGIWRAGVDSFTHAPWWRQWIGYGPDAASFNYYNWMPAYVQRIEGYSESIDRLHSDFLETLLSFGLLGLLAQISLFSALVWSAAQRLLPLPGAETRRRPAWVAYAAWVALGAAAGALLAYVGGASIGVLPVGAGAGLGGAWVLFIAWRAWRHVRAANTGESGATRGEALLIAAMVSALIGSWAETQVGVPTIATRALVAAFAALIPLTVHAAWRQPAAPAPVSPEPAAPAVAAGRKGRKKQAAAHGTAVAAAALPATPSWYPVLGWAACLALIISVADFYPPLSGTRMLAPSMLRLPLIIWPQLLTVLAAFFIAQYEAARNGTSRLQALTRFLLWSVPGPLLFAIVYAELASGIDNAPNEVLRERIAALTTFCFAVYALMPALLAVALYWGNRGTADATRRAGIGGVAALAAAAAFCVLTFFGARTDFSADVGAKLAAWAQSRGQYAAAAEFLRDSMGMMPQERRFAGSYAARLIEAAAADIGHIAGQPAAAAEVLGKLTAAEQALARAHELAPRDPWITFSYANVHQFICLRALSDVVSPAQRQQHIEAARKYIALAHQQFPGHPWILRNWAQLEFDQGNRALAYAKVEEMEKLDPRNLGAYAEWLKLTRMDNNSALAYAAVRRGLGVMPPGSNEAATLLQMLIDIPREAGNVRGALAGAQEYTATQPGRIGAWRQLAELYAINRQPELALSNAQAVLERFAGAQLSPQGAKDYAALQDLVKRFAIGNAPGSAAPAPAR
jgi:tetratricopeptide (TPR) repeat protein